MLDDYMSKQKIVYKILVNEIKNNTCSHAYLFESNGNDDTLNLVLSFVKTLFCPHKYTNYNNCVNCTQCLKIDKNIYSDLEIINPDGLWIKKNQLEELQRKFSTKSIENNKKIYIINNAELLNVQASNSILKFLEEPEDGILAILITNNIYQLLPTIVSRCQVISLTRKNQNLINYFLISEEVLTDYLKIVNNFILNLEKNQKKALLMTQKLWHDYFKERKDLIVGFELILLYYKDVLNVKVNKKIEIFKKYENDIIFISNNNTYNSIIFKINKIIELKEYIKINANQNLLLDKLILEVTGGIANG